MQNHADTLTLVEKMFGEAADHRVILNTIEDNEIMGRMFRLRGKNLLNFGSCSYLGLETDERLKAGAVNALQRYGTQFSSSRTYVELPLYTELEALLRQVFAARVIVTPTTTLAHMNALPALIHPDDVVILDQQVHHSVQMAAHQVRVQGTATELLRHNRMDLLEQRIETLRAKHRRIWYLADGVYSMYGDLAPTEKLRELLDRYPEFHLYIDDAHGISCYGDRGQGHVLRDAPIHPRMVVTASFAKAFGVGGGAVILPSEEWERRIRLCGGPLTFSGPLQPANLGALIASAKIHLSSEIQERQQQLQARIQFCNQRLQEWGLPVISPDNAPIRYIGLGLPRVAYRMASILEEAGFYVNTAHFPAVPMRNAGIRFTITLHQTFEDISNLVDTIATNLPKALAAENSSIEEVYQSFRRSLPMDFLEHYAPPKGQVETPLTTYRLQRETTIERVDQVEWDWLLGDRGSFTWEGLKMLEELYGQQALPENRWDFRYYFVRDENDVPVLATFCTSALWKDDMVSSAKVSQGIERQREKDPYLLTTRVFAVGSLLTEGNHLYLDRSREWRTAFDLLLQAMEQDREELKATRLVLRDMAVDDIELDRYLLDQGYVKFDMPASNVVEVDWRNEEDYLGRLSYRGRKFQKTEIIPRRNEFQVQHFRKGDPVDPAWLDKAYELYLNVKYRGLALNTFDLPRNFFPTVLRHENWELTFLFLVAEPERPIGVSVAYIGPGQYVPMVIGLDYDYVEPRGSYRYFLDLAVRQAGGYDKKKIYFGFGADLEKQRFGAKSRKSCMYCLDTDSFNMERLLQLMADAKTS